MYVFFLITSFLEDHENSCFGKLLFDLTIGILMHGSVTVSPFFFFKLSGECDH